MENTITKKEKTSMKKLILLLLIFSANFMTSFAQKGVDDGSRFGHGEDSLRCLQNISIYVEYVKTKNYVDAYKPWKAVFTEAPRAQVSLYTNGVKIVSHLFVKAKDPKQRQAYLDELLAIYDQRIKYLDDLNKLVRTPSRPGYLLGLKAHTYVSYAGKSIDLKKAYTMLSEVMNMEKERTSYFVLQDFMEVAADLFKTDATYKEQFINDYMVASDLAEKAIAVIRSEKKKEALITIKDNIDAVFINSGAANCDDLNSIYTVKVEENKTNLDFLNTVVKIMRKLGCTENDAYFNAARYAHEINPTAETAIGCAFMSIKKEEDPVPYFEQAIQLETDNAKKAEYAYTAAVVISSKKKFSLARKFALEAVKYNDAYGAPYILIAKMYASNPNWGDEPALNRCTYSAAIDKLNQAKRVDPSSAEDANQLIRTYMAHLPKTSDLFFLGMKKGERVKIGGWIGETTTIRTVD